MSPTDPPVNLVEASFYHRATHDWLDLVRLLDHSEENETIIRGRLARVVGASEEEPKEDWFPLLGYFGLPGTEIAKGYGTVRIQCDIFAWPDGPDGGIEKIQEIDAALYDRFNKEDWTYDGRRYFCRQTDWRPGPTTGWDEPLHRVRELLIGVGG